MRGIAPLPNRCPEAVEKLRLHARCNIIHVRTNDKQKSASARPTHRADSLDGRSEPEHRTDELVLRHEPVALQALEAVFRWRLGAPDALRARRRAVSPGISAQAQQLR